MSKSNFQCAWDNVDNVIHIIGSIIDFHYNKPYLYDMKYLSIEDDDFLQKSVNFIKYFLQMRKPFGFGYLFKSHSYPINECF